MNVKMNKLQSHKQSGLTLIELMVVITILGILAAMVANVVVGKDDKARVETAKMDIRSISQALDMYKLDNYGYPTTDDGLEALVTAPPGAKNWDPNGYLPKMPTDPWDNEYVYFGPDSGNKYEIVSYGADGPEGGEGFAADISSVDI